MRKTYRQLRETSARLITNDNDQSSHVETWGIDMHDSDTAIMQPVWACGRPCKVNAYDEDGELVAFEAMNAVQMKDHLELYHAEKGHVLYMPWVQQFFERVNQITGNANQARKAKEEKDALELAAIKKEYGYV